MHCHILVAFVRLFPALHFRMWLKISRDSQAVRLKPKFNFVVRRFHIPFEMQLPILPNMKRITFEQWITIFQCLWCYCGRGQMQLLMSGFSKITVLSGENVSQNIFLPSALSKCLQMEWVQRAQIWYDKRLNLKFYKLVDYGRWISVSKFLPIFVSI